MGVTIKEIAEMAGVHRSTVDKVLHNRPGVSDPVRRRVQKIIDECNYQANPIGKALKMQNKELHIKVILLEVDAMPYLKMGIEKALRQYSSFQIQVEYVTVPYSDIECLKMELEMAEKNTDGIIFSPINTEAIIEKINVCADRGIPVVTVNTDIRGSRRLCYIGQDGFKSGQVAGRLMGEFLQGKGKVAVFTSDGDNHQSFPFGTREGGFRSIVSEYYPALEILQSIYTKEKPQVIRREMRRLCEEEPELAGVFITCGGARAVGDVLEEMECKNVKVICYENYPEILELLQRGIVTATIDSEIEAQGKKAIEVLLDNLIYDRKPVRRHLYSEIKILLKESL
ncbi:LacI family DNA-binding transcriptional regulator [Blautia sp.]|jgi:LacI family transcriptional regulator|uniref:LacI family DNA-binding transcriptional regulator n=1 Tax=Blautia sp. TaxID=1955243 RepID=UPI003D9143BF